MGLIQTSDEIGEIATALAKAAADVANVEKSGKNEAFKRDGMASRYATLGGVLDEVRPKLAQHGIYLLQMPINGEGNNIGIVTRLLHSSGQWIESVFYVAPMQYTAQGAGSVITYLRRYAAMAAAGVAPAEDDDGNAASIAAPAPKNAGMVRAPDVAPRKPDEPKKNNTPLRDQLLGRDANGVAPPAERLRAEIGTATTLKGLDATMKANADELERIKKADQSAYENLLALANAKSREFYSHA